MGRLVMCPGTTTNVKVFEIALVQANVIYNRYGWHDPQGRFFVLKSELERYGGLDAYIKNVEEARATFHNIRTGKELAFGTKAVIKRKDGSSFREYAMFVHDFALLFDQDGKTLNPPAVPGFHDDPGVMGINYRCEPMRERLKAHDDPAYMFSSLVHGDPATPILETYPGDEMVIRLLDGAHEEQHAFNLTGLSWKKRDYQPGIA